MSEPKYPDETFRQKITAPVAWRDTFDGDELYFREVTAPGWWWVGAYYGQKTGRGLRILRRFLVYTVLPALFALTIIGVTFTFAVALGLLVAAGRLLSGLYYRYQYSRMPY